MTIHRRSLWQHTPMAKWLSDEELAAISPDDGWFVFGVVRHPTARLFSAWQSKLLLREPWWWVDEFGGRGVVPARPGRAARTWWRTSCASSARSREDPQQRAFANRHFAPQYGLLVVDRMPYTRIYRTTEIPRAARGLRAPPAGRGLGRRAAAAGARERDAAEADPLAVRRPRCSTPRVRCTASDFEAFGYDDPLPGGLDPSDTLRPGVDRRGRPPDRARRAHQRPRDAGAAAQPQAARAGRRPSASRLPRPSAGAVQRGAGRRRCGRAAGSAALTFSGAAAAPAGGRGPGY